MREVCFRTGYMGDPVDWQWADSESFADMFTGYYTDVEPESAYVVEVDGHVSGYLLGCLDSSRAWNPARVAGRHIVRRGIAFRPGTAGFVWRAIGDSIRDTARRHIDPRQLELSDPRWPAHLHVDLLPAARGHGAGKQLVRRWFDELQARQIPGCFLGTFAENTNAIAFFETMGFRRHGSPAPVPGFRSRTGARLHAQTMVTEILL